MVLVGAGDHNIEDGCGWMDGWGFFGGGYVGISFVVFCWLGRAYLCFGRVVKGYWVVLMSDFSTGWEIFGVLLGARWRVCLSMWIREIWI